MHTIATFHKGTFTTFDKIILSLHIISVVVAFGVLFAYPLLIFVGSRLDPRAMPWFHQMQQAISRRLISPGLLLVVIFGVILASELHAWKDFYVQWGIGVSVVIGAIEGMFMIPRTGRLADLARHDLGEGDSAGAGAFSSAYRSVLRQVALGSGLVCVLVIVTIFLMAARVGG